MIITLFRISVIAGFFLLAVYNFSKFKTMTKTLPEITLEGKTMGTFWRVNIMGINKQRARELYKKIQNQLDIDDQLLSTYKYDSDLMLFNKSNSTSLLPINETIADIIIKALYVGNKTNGAMDITIGPLVNLWGFGPNKQLTKMPDKMQISNLKKKIGLRHLTVINQVRQQYLKKDIPDLFIDLSTVGEGYAADHLSDLMMKEGNSRYLITVGSALVGRGMNKFGKPWRIAIQEPTDQKNAIQEIVNINGYGISTSGSYRNYYEFSKKSICHIIDPKTGYPIAHNLISVTVIAPTALEADAWDTGLMVLGPEKAKEIALQQKLAVYMIIKKVNRFITWVSPQFSMFLTKKMN